MFRTFLGASPRPGPKSSLNGAFAKPSNFTLRAYGCMANLFPNPRLKPGWFPLPSPDQVTNDPGGAAPAGCGSAEAPELDNLEVKTARGRTPVSPLASGSAATF